MSPYKGLDLNHSFAVVLVISGMVSLQKFKSAVSVISFLQFLTLYYAYLYYKTLAKC